MKNIEEKHIEFVAKHYKPNTLDTQKAIAKFKREQGIKTPLRSVVLRISAIAASVVIGAFLLTRTIFMPSDQWVNIVAEGAHMEVTLPDQTRVVLAQNAEINYNSKAFGGRLREVNMSGEVYFDVQRDETLPFIVRTKLSAVEVLGTQFAINEQGDNVALFVESGAVHFSNSNGSHSEVLTRGQSAELVDDQIIMISQNFANPLAWVHGEFVYDATPLSEVLAELSDFYGVVLSTAPQNHNKMLTAKFSTSSLNTVIILIENALDAKINTLH